MIQNLSLQQQSVREYLMLIILTIFLILFKVIRVWLTIVKWIKL